jgi:DNA end-binding protein Ku
MIKGYEFAPDQYVTFTAQELKALEERATQTIEINEFVPVEKVDPVYFDKPYYLAPEKGGDKAYHLLAEVMRTSGRTALARYAARGKQYLVMIRPGERGLVMQQLLYADEVRSMEDLPVGAPPTLKDAELKLAQQLVDQITTDRFDPSQYEDEVKKRIQADIDRKVAGQEIEVSEPTNAPAQIIDLMEALKASLEPRAAGGKGRRGAPDGDAKGVMAPATATATPTGRKGAKPARDRAAASDQTDDVRTDEKAGPRSADRAGDKPARGQPAQPGAAAGVRRARAAKR